MNAIGIICEYNPFHLGHARMLEGLRRQYDAPLVCAMSGNFVQRGDAAVAHKHARGEMAVRCGADLVLELPTPWAMASAERFADGGVVAQIKGNGRLRITNVGGMNANNAEAENVRVITKFSGAIDGTVQLCDASVHVNGNYSTTPRTFDTVEVVLDEDVRSAEDVRKLGIDVGDFVCFDPRSRITESGYIKSRFLDDKLSVGILQAFAQYLKDENLTPKRRVYVHVTVYEEVGHGGSASVPDGVTEAISVDMGCVGEGVQCTERQVSICAKDSGGPYSYDVVRKLIAAAKREGADYAVDVYPHYGSDVEATLRAGYDIRHGLIGAGVYASHGYERSHRDGALNTLKVIEGYLFE